MEMDDDELYQWFEGFDDESPGEHYEKYDLLDQAENSDDDDFIYFDDDMWSDDDEDQKEFSKINDFEFSKINNYGECSSSRMKNFNNQKNHLSEMLVPEFVFQEELFKKLKFANMFYQNQINNGCMSNISNNNNTTKGKIHLDCNCLKISASLIAFQKKIEDSFTLRRNYTIAEFPDIFAPQAKKRLVKIKFCLPSVFHQGNDEHIFMMRNSKKQTAYIICPDCRRLHFTIRGYNKNTLKFIPGVMSKEDFLKNFHSIKVTRKFSEKTKEKDKLLFQKIEEMVKTIDQTKFRKIHVSSDKSFYPNSENIKNVFKELYNSLNQSEKGKDLEIQITQMGRNNESFFLEIEHNGIIKKNSSKPKVHLFLNSGDINRLFKNLKKREKLKFTLVFPLLGLRLPTLEYEITIDTKQKKKKTSGLKKNIISPISNFIRTVIFKTNHYF